MRLFLWFSNTVIKRYWREKKREITIGTRLQFFSGVIFIRVLLCFNDECEWIGVDETIYQTFLKWKRLKRKISINDSRFFMRFSCSARLSISNFGVVFLIKIYKRNIEKKTKSRPKSTFSNKCTLYYTLLEKSNFCPKIQFWENFTTFLVKSKLSTTKK